jgi:hypothetical protein
MRQLVETAAHRRGRIIGSVVAILVVAALVVAGALAYAWTRGQYFVGSDGDNVAIYQGVDQSLGPIPPVRAAGLQGGVDLGDVREGVRGGGPHEGRTTCGRGAAHGGDAAGLRGVTERARASAPAQEPEAVTAPAPWAASAQEQPQEPQDTSAAELRRGLGSGRAGASCGSAGRSRPRRCP